MNQTSKALCCHFLVENYFGEILHSRACIDGYNFFFFRKCRILSRKREKTKWNTNKLFFYVYECPSKEDGIKHEKKINNKNNSQNPFFFTISTQRQLCLCNNKRERGRENVQSFFLNHYTYAGPPKKKNQYHLHNISSNPVIFC